MNDAWYAEDGGAGLGDLLAAMRRLCRLEDLPPGARLAPWQRWVGRGEMERFFSAVPEALDGARELAEQADTRGILAERFVFPAFDGLERGRGLPPPAGRLPSGASPAATASPARSRGYAPP